MQIQIQIQNKYKWSNQIEPLTRTIPSENKHSADQIHSSSQILNSAFWLWVNNVWFRINNGRLFSGRNIVERLQRGQRGHTNTYTWVLDIFHLQEILLAAVVNMTHWGGFAMDTVWPHLPPSQQGWWKDINWHWWLWSTSTGWSRESVTHEPSLTGHHSKLYCLWSTSTVQWEGPIMCSSSSWYHNIVLKKTKVKVTNLNLNTLFALKDH